MPFSALALYLLASDALYRELISGRQVDVEIGIALYDGLFAALYVASFALLTRAFLVLALLEYIPQREGTPT